MTTPTRETLELAAIACGKDIEFRCETPVIKGTKNRIWQPYYPTPQGKADLLDLMLALDLSMRVSDNLVAVFKDEYEFFTALVITNGNKHAALAQAVLEVAAQVGAKMKEAL
jgi:hypothetical protein